MLKTANARLRRVVQVELVWVSLLQLVLITFFLADPLIHFPQTYYSPTDILQSFPVFALGSERVQPHNYVISDDILTYLPWHEFAAESLRRGELPLWNPYNSGGKPLLANMQGSFFNPLVWPGFILGQHIGLLIRAFLYLYLAGLFCFLYLRSLRLWIGAALTGMIAFTFSGMVVIWQHTELGATFILLPLELALIEGRLQGRLSNLKFGLLTSAVVAWQVFAGHPETIYLNTLVETFYLLFRLITTERTWSNWRCQAKTFGAFILAGLGGVILSAIQLLPFAEYLSNSAALTTRTGYTAFAKLSNALAFVFPNPFGNPTYGTKLDFARPNYSEVGGAYIGTTIIFLALASLVLARRRALTWFWLALSLAGLEIIYGLWPVYHLAAWLSPLAINYGRLVGYVAFFLVCMASLTLHTLHDKLEQWRKVETVKQDGTWWRFGLAGIAGAVLLGGLFWWFSSAGIVPFQKESVARFETTQFYFVCATFGFALTGLVVSLRWPRWWRLAISLVIVTVFLQVGWYGRSYRAATSAEYFKPQTPALQALENNGGRVTVAGSANLLPAEINMRYSIEQVNGYDSLEVRWFELARHSTEYNYPNWDNPAALNLFNIQQVLVSNKNPDFQQKTAAHSTQLERHSKQKTLNIYKNKLYQPTYRVVYNAVQLDDTPALVQIIYGQINPLDTVVLAPGPTLNNSDNNKATPPPVKVITRTPNRATVQLVNPQPGYLYLDQTYFPGWRARVNGQEVPVLRANVAFTALPIPSGDLKVELEYDPLSFKLGLALSLGGLLVWLLLANLNRIQRRFGRRAILKPAPAKPSSTEPGSAQL